ncbi:MAG: DUF4126 domain-containing protein [Acidimicrobiales bacterium]
MEAGVVAASGWSAGLNLWAVVLVLGLAGRFEWADTPAVLARTDVLVAAGVLYAVEFVVDKIPYVDSAWDVVNTAVRPVGAALVTLALARDGGADAPLAVSAVGAALGLSAHAAKASTRAAINLSPEPVTNVAASVAEDGLVVALLALALTHPGVALAVAAALALAALAVTALLWRFVRRLLARRRRRPAGEPA